LWLRGPNRPIENNKILQQSRKRKKEKKKVGAGTITQIKLHSQSRCQGNGGLSQNKGNAATQQNKKEKGLNEEGGAAKKKKKQVEGVLVHAREPRGMVFGVT